MGQSPEKNPKPMAFPLKVHLRLHPIRKGDAAQGSFGGFNRGGLEFGVWALGFGV